jgi:hypothetical protein
MWIGLHGLCAGYAARIATRFVYYPNITTILKCYLRGA